MPPARPTPSPTAPSVDGPVADALVHMHSADTALTCLEQVGVLARERLWYARACGVIGRLVAIVSAGGAEDGPLAEGLRPAGWAGRFESVSNAAGLEPARHQAGVPDRIFQLLKEHACKSVLIYQDQHDGGDVAAQTARVLRERGLHVGLIARAGYHWSWTVARDLSPDHPRAVAAAFLEGELCRAADMVIATTRRIADNMAWRHHLPARKVAIVPNWVKTPPLSTPQDRRAGTVLYAGRLGAEKRVDLLIRAMACVGRSLPDTRLIVIGDGPCGEELRALAAALKAPVVFRSRAAHDELMAEMGRCAVYAQMSRFEGHPKTIIEAMAMGAPCVVTRAPGVDDEIMPGRTGVVCGDTTDDVAEAIVGLLQDPARAARIGSAAAADVRSRLSLDAVWPKMEAAWRAAMSTGLDRPAPIAPPVRWDQTLLNAGPDGAALQFAASIGAYARRLTPQMRRMFLDALAARVGSLEEITPDVPASRR